MENDDKSALLRRLNDAWANAKKNGATQKQAAQAMGYSNNSFFSALLAGTKPITVETAFKLSRYFERSPLDLTREVVAPYAEELASVMNQAQESEQNKDQVIYVLQQRLVDAGLDAEVKEPMAIYNPLTAKQRTLLELLSQLPGYETDLLVESLQSRVALVQGTGSRFTVSGLAATDAPSSADVTEIAPGKVKET